MQLTEVHDWISAFGVTTLGVDGLGLLLVLLTVALVPIGAHRLLARGPTDAEPPRSSPGPSRWSRSRFAVFLATDVFLFYVVFEATLIPAYFLIGRRRPGRAFAALKFLMYQLGGGLVLLAAVIGAVRRPPAPAPRRTSSPTCSRST